jgi:DNA mismatch repair protein MutS2
LDVELRTKRSLEWERLKSYLAAEASCEWSRELCRELQCHAETALVEVLLAETDEALAMLTGGFPLTQSGLPELREVIARLRTGAQLAASELVDMRKMLILAKRARARLHSLSREEFPRLLEYVPNLHPHEDLVDAINEMFDDDGRIRDDASPLLRSLRREVARLTNQTREEMTKIINSSTLSKALQDPLYTQRNGRYVLPVQANQRHIIQGIVHDSSASGLTVYVEPMSVVELTNKVRMKESDIEREIERLLAELSTLAYERSGDIEVTNRTLVEIDFVAARAALAEKYRGVKPVLSDDGKVVLKQARHPLLVLQNQAATAQAPALHVQRQAVIANDVMLGTDVRTLVITGPNTGGKTVYLKTVGLMALMVRAGLLLPCDHGSSMVVFTKVFADIGDEQSIEQSLSTFSSHMTNIIEVINRSDSRTLALLDEVGAGTDPREGAILARVVLEHLNNVGATTISTTHYGELKTLAYTTQGFVNGSFEFDEATLSPTYRLRIGVPGSSKAITIAARLGMRHDLVARANSFLSSENSDIQAMIEELEKRLAELDVREREFAQRQAHQEHLAAELQKSREDLSAEREKVRRGVAGKMQQELEEARQLVRSLIADLQKAPSIAKAQRLQKDLEEIKKDLGWLEPPVVATGVHALAVGQTIRLRSLNQKAVIEDLPEDRDAKDAQATVRSGAFKIKVPLNDIVPIEGQARPQPARHQTSSRRKEAMARYTPVSHVEPAEVNVFVRTSNNTLDLRGQRVDEAMQNLVSFLDSAYLHHTSPVMIIHGHGTGRVRAAVRDYLAKSPYSANFRPGENYEGGDGVTVVQFK